MKQAFILVKTSAMNIVVIDYSGRVIAFIDAPDGFDENDVIH